MDSPTRLCLPLSLLSPSLSPPLFSLQATLLCLRNFARRKPGLGLTNRQRRARFFLFPAPVFSRSFMSVVASDGVRARVPKWRESLSDGDVKLPSS